MTKLEQLKEKRNALNEKIEYIEIERSDIDKKMVETIVEELGKYSQALEGVEMEMRISKENKNYLSIRRLGSIVCDLLDFYPNWDYHFRHEFEDFIFIGNDGDYTIAFKNGTVEEVANFCKKYGVKIKDNSEEIEIINQKMNNLLEQRQ